jgi:hypothetical protein
LCRKADGPRIQQFEFVLFDSFNILHSDIADQVDPAVGTIISTAALSCINYQITSHRQWQRSPWDGAGDGEVLQDIPRHKRCIQLDLEIGIQQPGQGEIHDKANAHAVDARPSQEAPLSSRARSRKPAAVVGTP